MKYFVFFMTEYSNIFQRIEYYTYMYVYFCLHFEQQVSLYTNPQHHNMKYILL